MTRKLFPRLAAAFAAGAFVFCGAAAPALAEWHHDHDDGHHGDWHHDDRWRGGGVWTGGYYAPPPVVYSPPYPAYPPPPVVYAPGVSLNLPGVSVGIR